MTKHITVTKKSTLKDILSDPVLHDIFPYFIFDNSGSGSGVLDNEDNTLEFIQSKQPTWNAEDMAAGLNEIASSGKTKNELLLDVYNKSQIEEDATKAHVKLVHFFAHEPKQDMVAVLASGGAYGSVCHLSEGFEVAAQLAKMGIDAFCLTYRVGDALEDGRPVGALFPKPQHDMVAAIRFLISNQDALGIDMSNYAVGGFSAGGHVAACFGLDSLGFKQANLKAPACLLLAYPLINITQSIGNMPDPVFSIMSRGLFGTSCNRDNFRQYSRPYDVDMNINEDYPATFIVQAKDDPLINSDITRDFCEKLQTLNVQSELLLAEDGGHGFGSGMHCGASNWVQKAVQFWIKNYKRAEDESEIQTILNNKKKRLYTALIELLKDKSIDKISVTELCRCAGTSRITFYRNYKKITDILVEKLNKSTDIWWEYFINSGSFDINDFIIELIEQYSDNKELIKLAYKRGCAWIIKDHIFMCCKVDKETEEYSAYMRASLAGMIYGIVDTWIKRGMTEFPQDFDINSNRNFSSMK